MEGSQYKETTPECMEKPSRLMLLLLAFTSLHGGDGSRPQANMQFPVQKGG